MRPKPQHDFEFTSLPKSRSWLSPPRSLGRLMILIALLGLALAAYTERTRPRPVPMRARPVALQLRRAVPRRPITPRRDPSVKIARPGIDEAMIHTARQGIDDAMIVNPGRVARVPVFIVPKSRANQPPGILPPVSPTPAPRPPQTR